MADQLERVTFLPAINHVRVTFCIVLTPVVVLKCAPANSGVPKNGSYIVRLAYGLGRAERQKVTGRSDKYFGYI